MPEGITSEKLLSNIMETLSDKIPKQKSVSFADAAGDISDQVSSQFNRLFGREKPVHHLLGGGKSADVLLWRDKKMSMSVLASATAIWVLFEWLEYNLLPLVCFALAAGLVVQFLWSNGSHMLSSSASRAPRLVLPKELFVNIATSVGTQVNQGLGFLQDVACGGNIKQLSAVVGSLLVAAIIGTWCNFLTVVYIGFIAAHTLPLFYEKYENEVDSFVYKVLGQAQHQYRNLDAAVQPMLSKIPKGKLRKSE